MLRRMGVRLQTAAASISPMVEIHNLKDTADGGYLLRCTYREQLVVLSQYPQLGPRKEDPNDSTPQYDAQRRASIRLKPIHVARLLALMEGKDGGGAPKAGTDASGRVFPWDMAVAMEKDQLKLTAEVLQNGQDGKMPFHVVLSSTQLITFYRFMESALVESFGFKHIPRGVVPSKGVGGRPGL